MKIRLLLAAAGLAFAAGVSNAQVVVFTDTIDGQATTGSAIRTWDSSNGVLTHATYGVGVRLAGIDHAPSGTSDFIVANGPHPLGGTPSGSILHVANLFGGATTTTLASGQQVWEPIGLRYDARSNSVIELENGTGSAPVGMVRGLYGTNYGTGTQTLLQRERVAIASVINPTPEGRAWHEGGTYLTADSRGVAGRYYVMSTTGGRHVGAYQGIPNQNVSSTIWKVDVNGTATSANFSEMIDTATASFIHNPNTIAGAGNNYTDFRGICMDGNNDIYVTSTFFGLIVKITTDANGDFTGSSIVAQGLDAPETIEWDEFTNTLVFAQLGSRTLSRINLDGTGLTTLASNVHVRGITFVPAPGVLASLGLAGLAVVRRRR